MTNPVSISPVKTEPTPPANNPAEFASGALRSEKKLPYWKLPTRAKQEWARRFAKGEKYDIQKGVTHNWKCAIGTGDLEFIRQMFNHCSEHLDRFKDLTEYGPDHRDVEGETMFDHLGAVMWNAAALIEFLDKDPDNVCKALSQKPEKL